MTVTIDQVLRRARPVMPVLVIDDVATAVELAQALYDGGLSVLEVTLRTPQALDALSAIRLALPEVIVGAGTVIDAAQFAQVAEAGAQFAVSPGFTESLAAAAEAAGVAYLPGVMTPSEVLRARACGYQALKLFPADGAASLKLLQALQGPFADVRFCPTGGVNLENLPQFLRLANVACVGGTWLAPAELVRAKNWSAITERARQACALSANMEVTG